MHRRLDICLVSTVGLCVLLLGGCGRASTSSDNKTVSIDLDKVEVGPIRHEKLAEDLIPRIEKVYRVFSEVDPSPIEKWMEDFKRDSHPERELAIWESMASVYSSYTGANSLSLDAKKEVFQVLLMRSGSSDDEVMKHLNLKLLTSNDVQKILALFSTEPQPIVVAPAGSNSKE